LVTGAKTADEAADASNVEGGVLDLELHPALGDDAREIDLAVRDEDDDVRVPACRRDDFVHLVFDVGVTSMKTTELERLFDDGEFMRRGHDAHYLCNASAEV